MSQELLSGIHLANFHGKYPPASTDEGYQGLFGIDVFSQCINARQNSGGGSLLGHSYGRGSKAIPAGGTFISRVINLDCNTIPPASGGTPQSFPPKMKRQSNETSSMFILFLTATKSFTSKENLTLASQYYISAITRGSFGIRSAPFWGLGCWNVSVDSESERPCLRATKMFLYSYKVVVSTSARIDSWEFYDAPALDMGRKVSQALY